MRLGAVIADYRWVNRIGVRELAKHVGTSPATLSRFENGGNCDAETLTKILTWLFAKGEHIKRERLADPHSTQEGKKK